MLLNCASVEHSPSSWLHSLSMSCGSTEHSPLSWMLSLSMSVLKCRASPRAVLRLLPRSRRLERVQVSGSHANVSSSSVDALDIGAHAKQLCTPWGLSARLRLCPRRTCEIERARRFDVCQQVARAFGSSWCSPFGFVLGLGVYAGWFGSGGMCLFHPDGRKAGSIAKITS